MTQQMTATNEADRVLEVLVSGNLSVLTPPERLEYYNRVCASLDLNPLTKPFEFLTLNQKLVLYATKSCTDQLRQNKGVSINVEDQRQVGDLYMVTVSATDHTGRVDSDMGVVSTKNLGGENLANAMLKAMTKAKRRVTLSICGLGMLDETEVDDIPSVNKRPPVVMPQARVAAPPAESVDPETGEILIGSAEAEKPVGWTNADLKRALDERALTVGDLSPILGAHATRATHVGLINAWLDANEGKRLTDLASEAVEFHTGVQGELPAVT